MVYGWDHPCRHENCDKLHVPDDRQILRLDFGRDASYLTIDYYHRTNHEPLNRAYISIPKMAPSRQRQCSQSEIVKDILEEHAKVGGAFTGWLQAKCFIPAPQYNDNIWASPSPLQPLQSALK